MALSNSLFELPIFENFLSLQVNCNHLPWPQTAFFDNICFGNIDNSGFGSHNYQTVFSNAVAGRPQTVAIERSTYLFPVAEHQQCRAVPRFLNAAVILVKIDNFWIWSQIRLIFVGFRYQNCQGF